MIDKNPIINDRISKSLIFTHLHLHKFLFRDIYINRVFDLWFYRPRYNHLPIWLSLTRYIILSFINLQNSTIKKS